MTSRDDHDPSIRPTRLEATKGSYVFSMWVEVDGEPLPVYHVRDAPEGPEGWIVSQEGKEYKVKYNIRKKNPNIVIPDAADKLYPDFEISCCADGDLVDVRLSRLNELQQRDGTGATFEGRQLPRNRMRRLIFSKPRLTKDKTPKTKMDLLGTIEVGWQRCDASEGEAFVIKEKLPSNLVNEAAAEKAWIDSVTSYGPVEPSTKIPTNVCGTIHPDDAIDYMSMQLRYVSWSSLLLLGYTQEEPDATVSSRAAPAPPPAPSVPAPPVAKRLPASPVASRSVQNSSVRSVAPKRAEKAIILVEDESGDEGNQGSASDTSRSLKALQDMSSAVETMNAAVRDKVTQLQTSDNPDIPAGLAEIQAMSLAAHTMTSALHGKLKGLQSDDFDSNTFSSAKELTDVEAMNSAVRTMNITLQDKVKELQNGAASDLVKGVEKLQDMSSAVHTMNTALRDKLKRIQARQKGLIDSAVKEPKADVRRSTAKRRKIV